MHKVISVRLVIEVYAKPAYAFIKFGTQENADRAVEELNGTFWDGSKLKVEIARGRWLNV
jgi:RNA recognition motif-containing protein